jgi:hypothetical protein
VLQDLNRTTHGQLFLLIRAGKTGSHHLRTADPEELGIRMSRSNSLNQTRTQDVARSLTSD